MPQTKPIVSIENVVVSATVKQALDLNDINKKFPEVEYHPKKFPVKSPKTAILLFRTGNMVCTGAKSEDMAKRAVSNVVEKLRAKNVKIKNDPKVTVENIVSAVNLGGKIHLEQAARTLPRSMYEPEQFPGLVHRMIDPKTVILIFASGKLVCTGGKSSHEVFRAIHNIHITLEEKNLMYYD
jgi:transcription initiation factor TFIID TATA-box-binding protein